MQFITSLYVNIILSVGMLSNYFKYITEDATRLKAGVKYQRTALVLSLINHV